jgi:hypothetical protein
MRRAREIKSVGIIYSFYQHDYNTILCGEREGNLQVVQSNNLGGKQQNYHFANCGHIIAIYKTFRQGEVLLVCSRGIYFANLRNLDQSKVTLNTTEFYLKEQDVKGAYEYSRDMIMACMDNDINILIIDRKQKAVVRTLVNPSQCDNPLALRLFPEKIPFAMLKDKNGMTLVSLTNALLTFRIPLQSWY